jgi:hypothetical protein
MRPFNFLGLKIYKISVKAMVLSVNLWYHLPVLFFLIYSETSLKYCDLAKIAIKTSQFDYKFGYG